MWPKLRFKGRCHSLLYILRRCVVVGRGDCCARAALGCLTTGTDWSQAYKRRGRNVVVHVSLNRLSSRFRHAFVGQYSNICSLFLMRNVAFLQHPWSILGEPTPMVWLNSGDDWVMKRIGHSRFVYELLEVFVVDGDGTRYDAG